MRGGLFAALLCTALLACSPSCASASETGGAKRSALVVFLAPGPLPSGQSEDNLIEEDLSSIPTLSTAILSATQGTYKTDQLLLDITQGARVSYSAYNPAYPPTLSLVPLSHSDGARVQPWAAVLERAEKAPQLLDPGLLATSISGGAAYADAEGPLSAQTAGTRVASVANGGDIDGPLAVDRSGQIAAESFGPSSTLLARIATLRADHRLVVADLPSGATGYADLRTLAATRPSDELLIAIQRAPDVPGHELLWSAVAGLGPGGHTLTSQTTNQRGMIAAIDIGPTILEYLGLPLPADMRGKPVRLDGAFDGTSLRGLKARLVVIDSRRLPALAWLALTWALLLMLARLPAGRGDDPPGHGPRTRQQTAWAMRVGAIAMLWAPVAVLLPAALEPSRTVEFALIVATCFALGALTDLLMPWPRAPLVPALVAVLALTVDALAGTQLLMRSLLGPSPAFGARFYGIGNELKSGLAVLVFTAVAAALYPAVRSRRTAATMACAGIVLAIVEGSARIGAGVGGVILVSAGTAVATVMLLPGTLNRKRVLIVMAAPVLGLVALAAIDLATAHGSGHFTGSVLDARSPSDIRDIIVRRYSAAWDELKNHLMPVATALALVASFMAVRRRDRVLAPVASDPVWLAAFAGGLTSGVIGALTEDSGPVLLVVAVFALGCVLSYLWGVPTRVRVLSPSSQSTSPAERSHALRQSAAPSG
ncbi:MAG TPA: hypothetical protein VGP18_12530 [Solirubrobacteraceae bacterium]|jgi:hypothetical protein|nr:hypothetical protein [Solirubrobacteraceae bacterium]